MAYKILESKAVDIENVDGGAFNNFTAGGKSGVIAGVLNECKVIASNSIVTVDTGLFLISGIRIKLIDAYSFTLSGTPIVDTRYHLVAKVVIDADRNVSFSLLARTEQSLTQDNIYETEVGTYEVEIAKFLHGTNGEIKELRRTIKTLDNVNSGGSGSGLTETEKEKLEKILLDGTGEKFLADNGEYKEVKVGTIVTEKDADGNVVALETFDADTKVNRKTDNKGGIYLYGQDGNKKETQYQVANVTGSMANLRIPMYFAKTNTQGDSKPNGVLICGDPEKPYHTANMNYVDTEIAKARGKLYKRVLILDNSYRIIAYSSNNVNVSIYTTKQEIAEHLAKYYTSLVCNILDYQNNTTRSGFVGQIIVGDPSGGMVEGIEEVEIYIDPFGTFYPTSIVETITEV